MGRCVMRVEVFSVVIMIGALACAKTDGPGLCSAEGQAKLKASGASDEVLARACGAQPPFRAGQPSQEQPATWKVPPTPLAVIKADPPSYIEKPTLVLVAVKPSDYFNFGYADARSSHFAFRLRPVTPDGRVGPDALNGYAARNWARPFFEDVVKNLESGKFEYMTATLVVTYLTKRFSNDSADHIEILAAEPGRKLDMDPGPLIEKYGQAAAAAAKAKEKKEKARQQARAACPDEEMKRIFAQNCSGTFAMARMFGGRQSFDVDYFCRCAANRVNLDWAREIHRGCSIPDTGALTDYLNSDSVVLACRR
jgi:hypothetical protein